jgi:1-aminocyclopropane-1-carboxylate deaminase/D-cysteine desulfhydrase-like pyridoxal-dependent ACC family enzyme
VRVSNARVGPFPACTPATVERMMRGAARRMATHGMPVGVPEVDLRDDWFGAGYGVASKAGRAAIARGAELGIALEQTYTGKAFAAFLERIARQPGPVMFWNTFNSRDD